MEIVPNTERKMQKVPLFFREKHAAGEFDPGVVSFGPYHHGSNKLQEMERFKVRSMDKFLEGSNLDVAFFQTKVLQILPKIREAYIENSTVQYGDDYLSLMIVYDGCLLLNFMSWRVKTKMEFLCKFMGLSFTVFGVIIRDIFLLENQLPVWVLEFLHDLRYGHPLGDLIHKYIKEVAFLHDLDNKPREEEEKEPLHILDVVRGEFLGERIKFQQGKVSHFPISITEMEKMGIHLKPSKSWFSLKPNYVCPTLEIPVLRISFYSESLYPNIIAYEIGVDDFSFSQYIRFLTSCLQSVYDVNSLRKKGIISSFYGDKDEKALEFLKNIRTTDLGFNVDERLGDIIEKIQNLGKSGWKSYSGAIF